LPNKAVQEKVEQSVLQTNTRTTTKAGLHSNAEAEIVIQKSNKSEDHYVMTDEFFTKEFMYYLSNGTTLLQDIVPSNYKKSMDEYDHPPPICGFFKCFVPSQHHPTQYGYTIGQYASKMNTYSEEIMIQTYQLVKRLEQSYDGFHHLYHPYIPPTSFRSQPLHTYFKEEMIRMEMINNGTIISPSSGTSNGMSRPTNNDHNSHWSVSQYERLHGGFGTTKSKYRTKKFSKRRDFLIQVFRMIPNHSFLFYCRNIDKQRNLTSRWLDTLHNKGRVWTTGKDLIEFDSTLNQSINQTTILLMNEPQIALDFQIAIDPMGMIWHFDMDRALGHNSRNKTTYNEDKKIRHDAQNAMNELQDWYRLIHDFVEVHITTLSQ
jgi:hypothetical protein